MTKRTFTKYPSSYVKASRSVTKRYYVYYIDNTDLQTNLLNAIISDALSKYDVRVNFGYRDSKSRSLGPDVCVCIIDAEKAIAKSKLKSIIKDELDVDIVDIESEEFESF